MFPSKTVTVEITTSFGKQVKTLCVGDTLEINENMNELARIIIKAIN